MKERMPIGFMFKQINTIYEKDLTSFLKQSELLRPSVLFWIICSAAVKNP